MMKKFFVRFHISGNKVVTRKMENYEIHDVLTEVNHSVNNSEVIMFELLKGHIYCLKTSAITHFEVLTEERHEELRKLGGIEALMSGAFHNNRA